MAKNEIWAWCPYCEGLLPAKKNWRNRIICSSCGEDIGKEDDFHVRDCPECGREIYAPEDRINNLACPCGAPAPAQAPEPVPEPEPAPEPAPEPEPELSCSECGGIIEHVNGVYRCPVCGKVFSEDEIRRMKYFAAHNNSINIRWDNSGDAGRVLYVHPHSSSIGNGSAIVVGQFQGALYEAGGEYHELDSGTYSLFWDENSEQAILKMLDYGRYEGERPIQLGTKVIFFDKRKIDRAYTAPKGINIGNTNYAYWPVIKYKLSISDPFTLMGNQFNFASNDDGWAVQNMLVEWAESAIFDELYNQIFRMTCDGFTWAPAHGVQALIASLRDALKLKDVSDAINKVLREGGRGIQIMITSIDVESGLHEKLKNPAICPHCGGMIQKQKGIYACPLCGKKLWICPFCETPNVGSVNICVNDGKRGPY